MNSGWNIVGIIAWVILVGLFVFVIHDIRRRHLKMIVVDKKKFSYIGTVIDVIEILVLIIGFFAMSSVTFFNRVDINDRKNVEVSYKYEPLVIQTSGMAGYYVVKTNNGSTATDKYTFWETNSKYSVTSRSASIVDSSKKLDDSTIANLKWDKDELQKNDKKYQNAFVVTMKVKYKNNFINGLGLHSGGPASEYRLIKVPNENFILNK